MMVISLFLVLWMVRSDYGTFKAASASLYLKDTSEQSGRLSSVPVGFILFQEERIGLFLFGLLINSHLF
jgi:hypothetical protein